MNSVKSTTAMYIYDFLMDYNILQELFGIVLDKRLKWIKHFQLSLEQCVLQFTICDKRRETDLFLVVLSAANMQ